MQFNSILKEIKNIAVATLKDTKCKTIEEFKNTALRKSAPKSFSSDDPKALESFLNKEKSPLQELQPRNCDRCDTPTPVPAVDMCVECRQPLCSQCSREVHRKRWKNHRIIPLNPGKAANSVLSPTNLKNLNQAKKGINPPPGMDAIKQLDPARGGLAKQRPVQRVPTKLAETEKRNKLRREIINEIITTERDYVNDLTVIVEVFKLPIEIKGVLSADEVTSLFRYFVFSVIFLKVLLTLFEK